MDIAVYLKRQEELAHQQSKQVKDFSVFDYNYIPDQPIMRDESKELIDAMVNFNVSAIPTNLAVIGSKGSGKTLTVKYLQREIPKRLDLDMIYINCREQNTTFKIFAHLVGGRKGGESLMYHYERFLAQYPQKTVVVLDEIDLMSPKDKRREILYLLSRSRQPYLVIMLSNTPHVLNQLDAPTRSSLQPFPVHFRNYHAQQIQDILQNRAQDGFHSWDESILANIAALTTRFTNSDARVAIKTLLYTVTYPQQDVNACFEKARRDVVIDLINDLSDQALRILLAAISGTSDLAKDVYKRYCQLCSKHHDRCFSYVHFYANLSYLQSVSLIALATAKVDRTYTNRVVLTCDRSTLQSICKIRFG